jgi:uncharacterized membrane protein (DUF2068 family)
MSAQLLEHPPGVRVQPSRFRPRFHWELLVCGCRHHALVGLDAECIKAGDELIVFERDGIRWHRCLRCDSWVPLNPPKQPTRLWLPDREQIELPLRGKPLRDKIVLRAIAVNRALHWFFLTLIGLAILVFSANRADMRDTAMKIFSDLSGSATNNEPTDGILGKLSGLFDVNTHRLHVFALIAIIYGSVEGLEAVGLWFCKRWAECLTFWVTVSLLPLEIYELSHHVSPFKVAAFIINIAVVAYLLYAKRLFGFRGGVAADEALKARDVGWQALERSTPAKLQT